jgi:hypothetical protein
VHAGKPTERSRAPLLPLLETRKKWPRRGLYRSPDSEGGADPKFRTAHTLHTVRRQWSPHDRSAAPFPRAGKMPQTPCSSNTFCDSLTASYPQTERRPGCGAGPSKEGVLGNTPMGSGWMPHYMGAEQSRRNAKNAYLNAVALQQSRSTHAVPHILQNRQCMRNKRVAMMALPTRLLPRTP